MKTIIFAKRNFKELVKDPLSLVFCIALPAFLLIIISIMQKSIQQDIFSIEVFTPGIMVFSFSFITLFSGMLISNDRVNSFLIRLFASPMKATNYILGYTLPLLLVAVIQSILSILIGMSFGLKIDENVILLILSLIPIAVLFVGMGFLIGTFLSDKQVGGFSSVIINIVAFTSGMWFDLSLMGGAFKVVCEILPFYHAVNIVKYVMNGIDTNILLNLIVVIIYSIVIYGLSILMFRRKMKNN